MEERERAAGLYLAGNDPMSGRRPSGMTAVEKSTEKNSEALAKESATYLKSMDERLSKLDSALSN